MQLIIRNKMKKLIFFILLIPMGIVQGQVLWTDGMTPAQVRTTVNGNASAAYDSLEVHRIATNLNYNWILTAIDTFAAHNNRFTTIQGGAGQTQSQVANQISDSLTALVAGGVIGMVAGDSGVYAGGYVTPSDLDVALGSATGGFSRMVFQVGTTENAPSNGDSTLTHGVFYGKHLNIFKTIPSNQDGTVLLRDYGPINSYGQRYTLSDSTITLHRLYFESGHTYDIHIYPLSSVTAVALRDTTPISNPPASNMISNGDFTAGAIDWTMHASVTVGGGVINIPRAAVWFSQLEADMVGGVGLQVSTNYRLTFNLVVTDADVLDFKLTEAGNADDLVARTTYSSGAITIDFTTPAVWTYPATDKGLRFTVYYSQSATIDNITLTVR